MAIAQAAPILSKEQLALRDEIYAALEGKIPHDERSDPFLQDCIDRICEGEDLTPEDAERAFSLLIDANLPDPQIGGFLVALNPDTLPASTLAACARVMRKRATHVSVPLAPGELLGDTCGTGSDTLGTFNVSTTIMFILAAAGIKIAKHGNYAVTSKCGSADVLKELGVRLSLEPEQIAECINTVNVGFMFAPDFHRAFSNVQRIRRVLAEILPPADRKRTVFNVLGPLANPAFARAQIIGVYGPQLVRKFAEVLQILGVERALVVFGRCDGQAVGLDEFSTVGESVVAELREGTIKEYTFSPEEAGLQRISDPTLLRGGDIPENAEILKRILSGREQGPKMDLALLNAAAGLYLGGKAESIRDGVVKARELIASGKPYETFQQFVAKTDELFLLRR